MVALGKAVLPFLFCALLDLFGMSVQIDGSVWRLSVDRRKYMSVTDDPSQKSLGFVAPASITASTNCHPEIEATY